MISSYIEFKGSLHRKQYILLAGPYLERRMVVFQQQEHREYNRVTSNRVRDQCIRVPQTLLGQHMAGYKYLINSRGVQVRIMGFGLPSTPSIEHRIS